MIIMISILIIFAAVTSSGRAGETASLGHCRTHNFGGVSGLHYYVCCNNCNEASPLCDGYTYQTASNKHYCGPCGVDAGNAKDLWTETCGGCSGQAKVESKCKNKWYVFDMKGTCFTFNFCMKEQCKNLNSMRMLDTNFQMMASGTVDAEFANEAEFCGDGICNGGETVEGCAMDCCVNVNPQCNYKTDGQCPPLCCTESNCSNHAPTIHNPFKIMIIMIVTSYLLLIYK